MKTKIRQVLPVAAELFLKQSFWKEEVYYLHNKKSLLQEEAKFIYGRCL